MRLKNRNFSKRGDIVKKKIFGSTVLLRNITRIFAVEHFSTLSASVHGAWAVRASLLILSPATSAGRLYRIFTMIGFRPMIVHGQENQVKCLPEEHSRRPQKVSLQLVRLLIACIKKGYQVLQEPHQSRELRDPRRFNFELYYGY